MANIKFRILKRVNETSPKALLALYNAMLNDLIERRKPRDPELFRWHMTQETINASFDVLVEDFNVLAANAFAEYHKDRAQGAHIENGVRIVPEAEQPDTEGEDTEGVDDDTEDDDAEDDEDNEDADEE